ncbi:MAG: tRNA (adenosine(37)-N6)-dimethylallyltransferase MiaA [Bacteroidales bacterium]|nr:tRNA (adenosine(37)-N6)-dimethylallyltransferase MiaA [Candidatus Colimorpha onthohippi]
MSKKLIIVVGATASGKTAHAITLALRHHTEIISCDSRQCYRELNIGVARPTPSELAMVPHHFIACRSVLQPYNIYEYEQDAMSLLNRLFECHDVVVAVGGSGLYVEALRSGVAVLPDPAPGLRSLLQSQLEQEGIGSLQRQLLQLDPDYYHQVDLNNPIRLQRALEVSITAGKPYSQIIASQTRNERPFEVELEMVNRTPDELRTRINLRVDDMISRGLQQEVESVWHLQQLNTLQTVGYREFFAYPSPTDAATHLDDIVNQIKLATWHYAKKQLTWFRKKMQASGNF